MIRERAALWLRRELSFAWAEECSLVKRGLAEDKALRLSRKYTIGWVEIFALIMHWTVISYAREVFHSAEKITFYYQKSALLLGRELHIS